MVRIASESCSSTQWLQPRKFHGFRPRLFRVKGKVKVKVHTLDIAPLRSESPLQKRSGMARVLK